MPCFLQFDRFENDTWKTIQIELSAKHPLLQHAMMEAKGVYRKELGIAPKQGLRSPKMVCESRAISLHLHPTQVQQFSLQM